MPILVGFHAAKDPCGLHPVLGRGVGQLRVDGVLLRGPVRQGVGVAARVGRTGLLVGKLEARPSPLRGLVSLVAGGGAMHLPAVGSHDFTPVPR